MGLYPSRRRQVVCSSESRPTPPDLRLACSGLFLKEHGTRADSRARPHVDQICYLVGTEVEGTFRVSGSSKRMSELQTIFETPPKVCLLALNHPLGRFILGTERPPLHQRFS